MSRSALPQGRSGDVKRLLWIDLEMSGLDPRTCRILEVAAIVTDVALAEIEAFHAVVRQPDDVLAGMDSWCQKHHGKSGLIAEVPGGRPEAEVEEALVALVSRHWKKRSDPAVLCGNSIGTDRQFIAAWMPRLEKRLHYRMVDVSSWKVILRERFGVAFKKGGRHRALGDVRESIAELAYYLTLIDASRVAT